MPRTIAFCLWTLSLIAASPRSWAGEPTVIELWPDGAPDEVGEIPPETVRMSPALEQKLTEVTASTRMITDVSRPTISVYRPKPNQDSGTAVLILPGGGYWNLYWEVEGVEVADWLNSQGIAGIILKYRVPRRPGEPEREPAQRPQADAQRAISLIRSKAQEWNVAQERIGVMGFSAGGHLALATATNFSARTYAASDDIDRVSCRPDFAVAVYSGYLKAEGKEELASGLRVPAGTPPVFLVHGGADIVSRPEHSVTMYSALQRANIPAELHIFDSATHGFGVRPSDRPFGAWTELCIRWLKARQFLQTQTPTD